MKVSSKYILREGAAMVNDSLAKIYQLIVPMTPIKSGDLRRGYRIIKARKLSSGRIVGALINNEKYFRYVNDGHRTKNGGFVKGRFMLQKSNKLANATYIPKRFKQMAIIIVKKVLTDTIKQFSNAPIYLDDVMQSSEPFYFVLSLEESLTDNVGQNVQNKAYNVDIALVDSKKDKQLVTSLTESCGAFFNVLNLDGNELFPEDYQTFKTDGIQHINFNVAFPQLIEWSEK